MNNYRASPVHPLLIGLVSAAIAAVLLNVSVRTYPEAAATEPLIGNNSWLHIFIKGGWSMWPIFIYAIYGLLHIFSQALSQRKQYHHPAGLEKDLVHLVDTRGVDAGLAFCLEKNSSISLVLYATLLRYGSPRYELETCIKDETSRLRYKLQHNSRSLMTIIAMVVFCGLLGSTCALIQCFDTFNSDAPNRLEFLIHGIALALIPFVFAILIIIPLLLGYVFNRNNAEDITHTIEERSVEAIVCLDRKARRSIRLVEDIEEHLETQQMTAAKMPISYPTVEPSPDLNFDIDDTDKALKSSVTTPAHLFASSEKTPAPPQHTPLTHAPLIPPPNKD